MKKLKILDNTTIKLIAILIMLMDHITITFFPEKTIFIKIGEIAFPLFAFLIAEGFHYTKDRKKYFMNLFGFALLSEGCFDLGLYGKINWLHQNVLFTMSIAVLLLISYEKIKTCKKFTNDIKIALICAVFSISLLISLIMFTDHTLYGVILIFIYYILRDKPLIKFPLAAILLFIVFPYKYALISIPILLLYNGKRGYNIKYFFYAFYPVHLSILAIIRLFVK